MKKEMNKWMDGWMNRAHTVGLRLAKDAQGPEKVAQRR